MPNNRVKTIKALQSKKGKVVLSKLHPHSRRAKQLNRIALRDDKLTKNKREKRKMGNLSTTRFVWFIEAFEQMRAGGTRPTKAVGEASSEELGCSIEELHGLIERFIDRNQPQIEEEGSKRSSKNYLTGRPRSSLQEKLETQLRSERDQYLINGFVLPDLMTPENLKLVRQWKTDHRCDDLSFLRRIRLIRLFKNEPTRVVEEQRGVVGLDAYHAEHPTSDIGLSESDDDSDIQLIEVDE